MGVAAREAGGGGETHTPPNIFTNSLSRLKPFDTECVHYM